VQVRPTICKSGALTQDGSNCSNIATANSSTGPITRYLMSQELKMLKATQLEYGLTVRLDLNNGKLSILTKLEKLKLRD